MSNGQIAEEGNFAELINKGVFSMPCLLKINLIMNLFKYLKSKYRKFISTGLDKKIIIKPELRTK